MISARMLVSLALIALGAAGCPRGAEDPAPAVRPPDAETPAAPDLTVGALFEGVTLSGRAGGTLEASQLDPSCVGLVEEAPSHRVAVAEPAALTLRASPVGSGFMDLALALRSPSGRILCFDDSDTLDPVAAFEFEPGVWEIHVAAIAAERPPYELRIEPGIHTPEPLRIGNAVPARVEEGEPAAPLGEGTFGGVRFGPESAAARLEGTAGGPRHAAELRHDCAGWIATAPDHVVEVEAPMEVLFAVASEGDTTLVIRGPNDTLFCADDTDGLNPVLRQLVSAGRWEIHVGSFQEREALDYTLWVSR